MSGRTGDVRVRMQELQSIAGGRLFGAAVEGRLRPLSHHQYHLHHQAIKCPRCDSVNTKFCYYNNYNLSQPRHFCKSCRRYWTNGGVLRNVPVGGGCRKNKRSKAKQSPPEQPSAAAAPGEFHTAANSPPLKLPEQKSSSHSSSGSSNLTAAATEAVTVSTQVASFSSGGSFLNIREYESLVVPTTEEQEPNPDGACMRALLGHGAETGAFTDTGNFADLMTASAEPLPSWLEFSSVMLSQPSRDTCQQHQWPNHPDQSQTLGVGDLFHQTVQVDFSGMGSVSCGGGFGVSDWRVKDRGDFGLPTTVDQAYLSQGQSQWTDRDQGQYPETVPYINFSQFPF